VLAIFVPGFSPTGENVIELPLRAVRMIGIGFLPRRNAENLHVEGMPLQKVCRFRLPSQCDRDTLPKSSEAFVR
jgi:hypothetical protein